MSIKIPREIIEQYIEELKVQYDSLSTDPFANKARMSVRQEIETMKDLLAEDDMQKSWECLDRAFNIGAERPDRHAKELAMLQAKAEVQESFKSKFNRVDLEADPVEY